VQAVLRRFSPLLRACFAQVPFALLATAYRRKRIMEGLISCDKQMTAQVQLEAGVRVGQTHNASAWAKHAMTAPGSNT
jgi:hypothetical protein